MKLKLLILVLALQSAWLLAVAFVQERALSSGKVILLETAPVDPRDLMRGDYLILNYKISDVATNLFSPPVKAEIPPGTIVFVAVAPGTNQFFRVTRAGTNEFAPAPDEIMLRAQAAYPWWNRPGSVHLYYGIERFYVAEGTGRPTGKLTVQAVVSSSDRAMLKQLFVDGKPYADAMKSLSPSGN
jgi:uncharacterized membrane-anchored protein